MTKLLSGILSLSRDSLGMSLLYLLTKRIINTCNEVPHDTKTPFKPPKRDSSVFSIIAISVDFWTIEIENCGLRVLWFSLSDDVGIPPSIF